eukprot:CAMPEP_0194353688 /NCGR_PEP_ID=MMETSP0174-20130528/1970_1 /TAXON_ID=216777 /ORGANISM="Proboscia alata, Strain PI-D3" /LENGTH=1930 /DNA_ID=CAMNT_0039122345 /DNA_START=179 /DNA_END=5971 /DNA_ORIENTATION=+
MSTAISSQSQKEPDKSISGSGKKSKIVELTPIKHIKSASCAHGKRSSDVAEDSSLINLPTPKSVKKKMITDFFSASSEGGNKSNPTNLTKASPQSNTTSSKPKKAETKPLIGNTEVDVKKCSSSNESSSQNLPSITNIIFSKTGQGNEVLLPAQPECPPGWMKRQRLRGGKSSDPDSPRKHAYYLYSSPLLKRTFRSIRAVHEFSEMLSTYDGDEEKTFQAYNEKKKAEKSKDNDHKIKDQTPIDTKKEKNKKVQKKSKATKPAESKQTKSSVIPREEQSSTPSTPSQTLDAGNKNEGKKKEKKAEKKSKPTKDSLVIQGEHPTTSSAQKSDSVCKNDKQDSTDTKKEKKKAKKKSKATKDTAVLLGKKIIVPSQSVKSEKSEKRKFRMSSHGVAAATAACMPQYSMPKTPKSPKTPKLPAGSESSEKNIFTKIEQSQTPSTPSNLSICNTSTSTPSSKSDAASKSKLSYLMMCHNALVDLKDHKGSSLIAIQKWVIGNYVENLKGDEKKIKKHIFNALKLGSNDVNKRFLKIRSSYKINSEWMKKEKQRVRTIELEKKAKERKRMKEIVKIKERIMKVKKMKEKALQAIMKKKRIKETEKIINISTGLKSEDAQEKVKIKNVQGKSEKQKKMKNEGAQAKTEQQKKDWIALIEEQKRKKEELARKKEEIARIKREEKEKEMKRRAEENERERIRKQRVRRRRFPMDDCDLVLEDKELRDGPTEEIEPRPALPLAFESILCPSKCDSQLYNAGSLAADRNIVVEILEIFHVVRGDVNYLSDDTPEFELSHLVYAIGEIINGNSRKSQTTPPLLVHMMVTLLSVLTRGVDEDNEDADDEDSEDDDDTAHSDSEDELHEEDPSRRVLKADLEKLGLWLTPTSWPEVCRQYMLLQDKFTIEVLPKSELSQYEDHFDHGVEMNHYGYIGDPSCALAKAVSKLSDVDVWCLNVHEFLALARALCEDILDRPEMATRIAQRRDDLFELHKAKKAAETHLRKTRLAFEGPKHPNKRRKVSITNDRPSKDKTKEETSVNAPIDKANEKTDKEELLEGKEVSEKSSDIRTIDKDNAKEQLQENMKHGKDPCGKNTVLLGDSLEKNSKVLGDTIDNEKSLKGTQVSEKSSGVGTNDIDSAKEQLQKKMENGKYLSPEKNSKVLGDSKVLRDSGVNNAKSIDDGEKAKWVPTVSKEEYDSAEKELNRASDAFECGRKKLVSRNEPMGYDRFNNAFYHFASCPKILFIEAAECDTKAQDPKPSPKPLPANKLSRTKWLTVEVRSVFDRFVNSLDIRGTREFALYNALVSSNIRKHMMDDMKGINDAKKRVRELEQLQKRLVAAESLLKAEVEAALTSSRRSGRLASQSQVDHAEAVEILKVQITAAKANLKPSPKKSPNYDSLTGLELQVNYDIALQYDSDDESHVDQSTNKCVPPKYVPGGWHETHHLSSSLWHKGADIEIPVSEMFELEQRCEDLSSWKIVDTTRNQWKKSLQYALDYFKKSSKLMIGPNRVDEEHNLNQSKRNGINGSKQMPGKETLLINVNEREKVSSVLERLKPLVLNLEARVFEMSGLEDVARVKSIALDNVSISSNSDGSDVKKTHAAWKKKIASMRMPTANSRRGPRDIIIEAINIACENGQEKISSELRGALKLHRTGNSVYAKKAALEVLNNHGGYDDPMEGDDDDETDTETNSIAEVDDLNLNNDIMSTMLSTDALELSGCLNIDDSARTDWINGVRSCKTLSRFSALVFNLVHESNEILNELEERNETFLKAIGDWEDNRCDSDDEQALSKSRKRKKKTRRQKEKYTSLTKVWTDTKTTENIVWGKIDDHPWMPAQLRNVNDPDVATQLEDVKRVVIRFIGNEDINVVKGNNTKPFMGPDESLDNLDDFDNEKVDQLTESLALTRRLHRAKDFRFSRSPTPRSSSRIRRISTSEEEKKSG